MSLDSNVLTYFLPAVALLTVLLAMAAIYSEYKKAKRIKATDYSRKPTFRTVRRVAILIASKDGEKTIAQAVRAAKNTRYRVYVVSDGSTDDTAKLAKQAGATVLTLRKNVGKPSALYRAYKHFKLGQLYDAVAILDDDVLIEKDFIRQAKLSMDRECAIAVGKNLTNWPENKKWNIWIAARAYSYWTYQITNRYIQSMYNVMNCISGSNSVYRTEVLDKVLLKDTPYIVDDTFWTLETHRQKLGTIRYSPKARAWLQDPTNLRDWYKQNLRWMWGTFQGIFGHKIGTKADKFNLTYLALMLDWALYIFSAPLTLFIMWQAGLKNLPITLLLLMLGYAVWVTAAAIGLRKPRLILFLPAIVVVDFLFRWIMVHGLIKAIKQPTVESCVWNSPTRFEAQASMQGA
jgi:cellulose synthase/poly-beta-1,6-N-acetylglucosamine synthase-like glycosyltransferase